MRRNKRHESSLVGDEIWEKKPSGAALRLLSVIDRRGLEVLM